MFCEKKLFLQGVRVVMALFMLMVLAGVLQAQTDPGARPVGGPGLSPCPISASRFPNAPACVDNAQPPDAVGDDGAGNVLGNPGNLGATWFQALTVFETKAVVGPVAQTGGATFPGLGPSFNALSCFQCHSQPAVGGSSPNKSTPGFVNVGNPQIGDAPTQAQLTAVTTAPAGFQPILKADGTGPVREVRFPKGFAGDDSTNTDPVDAGSVAELFVIQGRSDAPAGCAIGQEPFQTQISNNNVVFRIPIPTFGEGFVENTTDDELHTNAGQAQTLASNLGIGGITFNNFNTSGNDQTITRFGWKAQNKSMLIFAGEASNVEMGVTNENFPNERTDGNGQCAPNFEPEDDTVAPPLNVSSNSNLNDPRTILDIFNKFNVGTNGPTLAAAAVTSEIASNIENFAIFMRLNGAPSECAFNSKTDSSGNAQCFSLTCTSATAGCVNPNPSGDAVNSIQRGKKLFGSVDPTVAGSLTSSVADPNPVTSTIKTIGCVLCHSDFLTTTTSSAASLNNASFHPFSDFALHTMDSSLADGVKQGTANGSQFRSAPLWGIGQRIFFLHDGRAEDLLTAIKDHAPNAGTSISNCTSAMGEACQVIVNFNNLPATSGTTGAASQQDILNFLRSL